MEISLPTADMANRTTLIIKAPKPDLNQPTDTDSNEKITPRQKITLRKTTALKRKLDCFRLRWFGFIGFFISEKV